MFLGMIYGLGNRVYFFLSLAAFAAGASSLGASPITLLSGHIEKAGHFLQPATIAIGHKVMATP